MGDTTISGGPADSDDEGISPDWPAKSEQENFPATIQQSQLEIEAGAGQRVQAASGGAAVPVLPKMPARRVTSTVTFKPYDENVDADNERPGARWLAKEVSRVQSERDNDMDDDTTSRDTEVPSCISDKSTSQGSRSRIPFRRASKVTEAPKTPASVRVLRAAEGAVAQTVTQAAAAGRGDRDKATEHAHHGNDNAVSRVDVVSVGSLLSIVLTKVTKASKIGIKLSNGQMCDVLVTAVDPSGPLAMAIGVGDQIVSVNGQVFSSDSGSTADMHARSLLSEAEGEVTLLVRRRKSLESPASVMSAPHPPLARRVTESSTDPAFRLMAGGTVTVTLKSGSLKHPLGILLANGADKAVQIKAVDASGPLANAVTVGDQLLSINGEPCTSQSQAASLLRNVQGDLALVMRPSVGGSHPSSPAKEPQPAIVPPTVSQGAGRLAPVPPGLPPNQPPSLPPVTCSGAAKAAQPAAEPHGIAQQHSDALVITKPAQLHKPSVAVNVPKTPVAAETRQPPVGLINGKPMQLPKAHAAAKVASNPVKLEREGAPMDPWDPWVRGLSICISCMDATGKAVKEIAAAKAQDLAEAQATNATNDATAKPNDDGVQGVQDAHAAKRASEATLAPEVKAVKEAEAEAQKLRMRIDQIKNAPVHVAKAGSLLFDSSALAARGAKKLDSTAMAKVESDLMTAKTAAAKAESEVAQLKALADKAAAAMADKQAASVRMNLKGVAAKEATMDSNAAEEAMTSMTVASETATARLATKASATQEAESLRKAVEEEAKGRLAAESAARRAAEQIAEEVAAREQAVAKLQTAAEDVAIKQKEIDDLRAAAAAHGPGAKNPPAGDDVVAAVAVDLPIVFSRKSPDEKIGCYLLDGNMGEVLVGAVDSSGLLGEAVKTGDQVVSINGEPCRDHTHAKHLLHTASGTVKLIVRSRSEVAFLGEEQLAAQQSTETDKRKDDAELISLRAAIDASVAAKAAAEKVANDALHKAAMEASAREAAVAEAEKAAAEASRAREEVAALRASNQAGAFSTAQASSDLATLRAAVDASAAAKGAAEKAMNDALQKAAMEASAREAAVAEAEKAVAEAEKAAAEAEKAAAEASRAREEIAALRASNQAGAFSTAQGSSDALALSRNSDLQPTTDTMQYTKDMELKVAAMEATLSERAKGTGQAIEAKVAEALEKVKVMHSQAMEQEKLNSEADYISKLQQEKAVLRRQYLEMRSRDNARNLAEMAQVQQRANSRSSHSENYQMHQYRKAREGSEAGYISEGEKTKGVLAGPSTQAAARTSKSNHTTVAESSTYLTRNLTADPPMLLSVLDRAERDAMAVPTASAATPANVQPSAGLGIRRTSEAIVTQTFNVLGISAGFRAAFGAELDKSDEGLAKAFKSVDSDNSGTISTEEMKAYLAKKFGKKADDLAAQMIKNADLDGDGLVDFDEFKATMRAAPTRDDGAVGGVVGNVAGGVGGAVGATVNGVGGAVGATVNGVGSAVGATVNGVGGAVGATVNGVGGVVGAIGNGVGGIFSGIGGAVGSVGKVILPSGPQSANSSLSANRSS